MVAERRAAAGGCGVPYEAVAAIASPAHHAVDVAAALRGDGAVKRGVRGRAVQGWRGGNKIGSGKYKLRIETASHVLVCCH